MKADMYAGHLADICNILLMCFWLHREAMIEDLDLDQDGEFSEQELFAIITDDT